MGNRRSKRLRREEKQAIGTMEPVALHNTDDRLRSFPVLLAALLLAWIVFYPASRGSLVWDDNTLPFANPAAATMPLSAWFGAIRPLLMASYWLNFHFSGVNNTFPYHAVNICLHALAAWLVWICAARILDIARIPAARRNLSAGIVAALFLVHPLQTESVDYIAGRSEVLTGVFFFAAFAVFLKPFRSGGQLWRVASIIVLFVAAVLCKEHAVAMLGLFLLTDLFWNEGSVLARLSTNRALYLTLTPFVLAGTAFVLRILMSAGTAGFHVLDLSWWEYFATQWRVIPEYLRLFVLPLGQSADWMFPRSHSLLAYGGIVYGAALAASVFVAIRFRRHAPLAAYGYLVFLLLLLPTSSIVPVQDVLAERRMYLPLFGLGLATAGLLNLSETWLKAALVFVLLAGGALSWERSKVWRSSLDLWTDVTVNSPSNLRGRINLASALVKLGRCGDAVKEYEAARRLQPDLDNYKADLGLATAYGCLNDWQNQHRVLQRISQRHPSADLMADVGTLAARLGDSQEASFDFSEAIRLDPGFARAWALRGMLAMATHSGDANADFRKALALDPANEIARNGLAQLNVQNNTK